jgi:hypothetical protein
MTASSGVGGIFASSGDIVFDDRGTPLAVVDKNRPTPEPSLGTIAITVKDADVLDLKLVVKKRP